MEQKHRVCESSTPRWRRTSVQGGVGFGKGLTVREWTATTPPSHLRLFCRRHAGRYRRGGIDQGSWSLDALSCVIFAGVGVATVQTERKKKKKRRQQTMLDDYFTAYDEDELNEDKLPFTSNKWNDREDLPAQRAPQVGSIDLKENRPVVSSDSNRAVATLPSSADDTIGTSSSANAAISRSKKRVSAAWIGVLLLCLAAVFGYRSWQSATPPHRASQFREIQDIRVGDRVLSDNPTEETDDSLGDTVHRDSWRQIKVAGITSKGHRAEATLLRPQQWLRETGWREGGKADVFVPELDLHGELDILSISPCPPIKPGKGQIVTATFQRFDVPVINVQIQGSAAPIGTTASHPFWSQDRGKFVAAKELRQGELVSTLDGPQAVLSVTDRGTANVHNLEVQREHVYHVSAAGVLVHNSGLYAPNSVTARLRSLRGTAKSARWAKADGSVGLRGHFGKHGHEVGATTARQFDLSARSTIQNGRKFRYRDRATNQVRVGYFDSVTGLFTATSQTRKTTAILSHFPETWASLRKLPGFSTL